MMCKRMSFSSQAYSRFWPNSKDTCSFVDPLHCLCSYLGYYWTNRKTAHTVEKCRKNDTDLSDGFSFPVQNTKVQTQPNFDFHTTIFPGNFLWRFAHRKILCFTTKVNCFVNEICYVLSETSQPPIFKFHWVRSVAGRWAAQWSDKGTSRGIKSKKI